MPASPAVNFAFVSNALSCGYRVLCSSAQVFARFDLTTTLDASPPFTPHELESFDSLRYRGVQLAPKSDALRDLFAS